MCPDTGAFNTRSEGYLHPIGAMELCFSVVFFVFCLFCFHQTDSCLLITKHLEFLFKSESKFRLGTTGRIQSKWKPVCGSDFSEVFPAWVAKVKPSV